MIGFRGLRTAVRGIVSILAVVPALALVAAVLVDRGPAGEARFSLFPMALLTLDPFVWTCARNSMIFAVVVTSAALIGGISLGWLVGRRGSWERPVLGAAVGSLLGASPAFLALGMVGLWGMPQAWPWPLAERPAGTGGLSLESWRGLSLWMLWVGATLPCAVALVMEATASAVERIEPVWEDAARLAGAGRIRVWMGLLWPVIRPVAARAAAPVFALTLVEPGAPLILGLRRTLAFQIVELAGRSDAFPRAAVWSVLAGLIALGGRMLILRWGRPTILGERGVRPGIREGSPAGRRTPTLRAMTGTIALLGGTALGWMPVLGLVGLVTTAGPDLSIAHDIDARISREPAPERRLADPPIPQLATNSLLLGLEVAVGTLFLAWLVGPGPGARPAGNSATPPGLTFRIGLMPPLLQGIGILALPGLAVAAARPIGRIPGWGPVATLLGEWAVEVSPERNPWALLVCAVGWTVGLRLLRSWQVLAGADPAGTRSQFEAAHLAGASRARAGSMARRRPSVAWLGRFLLATGWAATSLTPALLFSPGMDGRIVAPGVLVLAAGPDPARRQAAVLALGALAVNLAVGLAARVASALPRDWCAVRL